MKTKQELLDEVNVQKEREANTFAQNMLISQNLWKSMMESGTVKGVRFENIVDILRQQARINHLDFNIVVWRWKYESHHYQIKGLPSNPIR